MSQRKPRKSHEKSLSRASPLLIRKDDVDSDDDFLESSPFSQGSTRLSKKSGLKKEQKKKISKFKLSLSQNRTKTQSGLKLSNPLHEIQRFQKYPGLLVPKISFTRVVKDVLKSFGPQFKVQSAALRATQTAAEVYLTTVMEGANMAAVHAKRVTVMPKDIELYQRMKAL